MPDLSPSVQPDGIGEDDLRAAIDRLQRERVSVGDAYRSIHLGLGLILFDLGKGRVVLVMLATLAAMAAVAALTLNPVLVLIGLGILIVEGIVVEASIEDWVEDHNAAVDERIKAVLSQREAEDDWSSLKGEAVDVESVAAGGRPDASSAG